MQTALLKGHKGPVCGLDLDASGGRLLSWSEDGTCRLWDTKTRRGIRCMAGGGEAVCSAAFSPTNEHLVLTASGGTISVYDLRREGVSPTHQSSVGEDCDKSPRAAGPNGALSLTPLPPPPPALTLRVPGRGLPPPHSHSHSREHKTMASCQNPPPTPPGGPPANSSGVLGRG